MLPIISGPLWIPGSPDSGPLWKIAIKFLQAIKSFFLPPKNKETPEDVAERNRAFQLFCERVNSEAKHIEEYVLQQLDSYGQYLSEISEQEAYAFLKEYRIDTRRILQHLDLLKMQVPGIIASELSRRISDTDAECIKIRRMLPGAEKENEMQSFLQKVISSAIEKCAQKTEVIMNQIQEMFVSDLEECLSLSRKQLEQTESELNNIANAEDSMLERARIRMQAKLITECCDMVSALFE